MGYFSELDISSRERNGRKTDRSYLCGRALLRSQLEDLNARLDELNELRPHDPLHPFYDRYFYEDYKTCYYDSPHTVQGLLAAIDTVTERIHELEYQQRMFVELQETLLETGATADGQTAIVSMFLPVYVLQGVSA